MRLDEANTNISLCLKRLQFHLLRENQYNVEYVKDELIVGIVLDSYGYEISAYFRLKNSSNNIPLQNALEYFGIEEFNGKYQLPTLDKIHLGLDYIEKPIEEIVIRLGETYESVFSDILIWYENNRKKRLEGYYFDTDMRRAEKYWKEKEYDKAIELYLKHKEKLSDTQIKKLNYIIEK